MPQHGGRYQLRPVRAGQSEQTGLFLKRQELKTAQTDRGGTEELQQWTVSENRTFIFFTLKHEFYVLLQNSFNLISLTEKKLYLDLPSQEKHRWNQSH